MIVYPTFQPIVNIVSDSLVAVEVLSRWYKNGKLISPTELSCKPNWGFVDLEVARFIQSNISQCFSLFPILFLNVSEETLSCDRLFQTWIAVIRSIVRAKKIKLVIEITEGVHDISLQSRWQSLTESGVELAVDDYGDKNSTLTRLEKYEWRYCKFDIRKLRQLMDHPTMEHCHNNGITLIVEQVETLAQMERANLLGIQMQQGYLHSKPKAISEFFRQVLEVQ